MIDVGRLAAIAATDMILRADRAFGAAGAAAARAVLGGVKDVYQWVAPERLSGGVTVFRTLDPALRPVESHGSVPLTRYESLPEIARRELTIQLLDPGPSLVWDRRVDATTLPPETVAYEYRGPGDEYLWAAGVSDRVEPITSYPSEFAVPTFFRLDTALESYAIDLARYSTCFILSGERPDELKGIWRDAKRIFLRAKPEATMRRSLEQFLRIALRDHQSIGDVRPEQNVDESKPVDLRVTWRLSNKVALIEIKWLGESLGDNGEHTTYTEARARDGSVQLADYLDRNMPRSATEVVVGYLVVFDARRSGLTEGLTEISERAGRAYAMAEIEFETSILGRPDFALPKRFFLEPVCA